MDTWEGRIIDQTTSTMRGILCLMSDLHIDAADHDDEAMHSDLEAARALNARISINGDVFDAIVPSDRKRHHPSVGRHDPDRDDIFNQLVKSAFNKLSPYADLIDVISPGNHERSVLKYHHIDLTSMLVGMLNVVRPPELPPIHVGAYRGFQIYRLARAEKGTNTGASTFVIFRHHGRGGNAPVTGGAIDLDRLRSAFEADLYWIGHKHQSIQRAYSRYSVGAKGVVYERKQRAVMSAGYKARITHEDPDADGDRADFGEQFYGSTQTGAQWVLLEARAAKGPTPVGGFVRGMRWDVFDSPNALLIGMEGAA